MAALVGVDVDRTISITFVIARRARRRRRHAVPDAITAWSASPTASFRA